MKSIRLILGVAGLLVSALFTSSTANAGTLPGTIFPNIPDSGTPHFFNNVKVRTNKGSWTITGQKGMTFTTLDGSFNVSGSQSYKIVADFTYNGSTNMLEAGGTVTVKGGISDPAFNLGNGSTLFTADLSDFNFSGSTLAFAIDNFGGAVCDLGYCSTVTESIYLDLNAALPSDFTSKFNTTGTATTTVPLPAAVWLFGAGLAFLGATATRRHKKGTI